MTDATPEQRALVHQAIEARIVQVDAPAEVIAAAVLALHEAETPESTCTIGKPRDGR